MNKKSFFLVISLCILTIVVSQTFIDLIETNSAFTWTVRYFTLPILILSVIISYFTYFRTIRRFEKREYRSLFLTKLRSISRIFMLTVGLTLIFSFTAFSLIVLTNTYLGETKITTIQGKVIKTNSQRLLRHGRFKTYYFITLKDEQLNRNIDLQVGRSYAIGETFTKKMNIGYWGLLYTDN